MRAKFFTAAKLKAAIVLGLSLAAIIAFFNSASAVILSAARARLEECARRAVDRAVFATAGGEDYSDLATVLRDSSGNIAAVTVNSARINYLARRTASLVAEDMNAQTEEGVPVPIGAFTGIGALSGYGALVNVKIAPVISVDCSFVSRFAEAGVNQTIHSIYAAVTADITLVLAVRSQSFSVTSDIIVCEGIIVGKVPDVYLEGVSKTT